MKVTRHGDVRRGSLPLYITAATLARAADAGAAVGLVLLALAERAHLPNASLVGGVLVTCLTAPHLAGPVLARRLDRLPAAGALLAATDPRMLLLAGGALMAATAGVATIDRRRADLLPSPGRVRAERRRPSTVSQPPSTVSQPGMRGQRLPQ